MNLPRGKTRVTDHFMETIPSHWNVIGDSFRHTRKGLEVVGDVTLSQTALTTFGFFRFRVQLALHETDVVQFVLQTAIETFRFVVGKNESVYQINETTQQSIPTELEFTLQWILNDERISLQRIGNGIRTLASRQTCASFNQEAFVITIATSFEHGSTMTFLESDYEFVNE
jgi:hypothetical protein